MHDDSRGLLRVSNPDPSPPGPERFHERAAPSHTARLLPSPFTSALPSRASGAGGGRGRRRVAERAWAWKDAACEAEARWPERLVLELLRTLVAFTLQAADAAKTTLAALC
jgi:hypothetical protein